MFGGGVSQLLTGSMASLTSLLAGVLRQFFNDGLRRFISWLHPVQKGVAPNRITEVRQLETHRTDR